MRCCLFAALLAAASALNAHGVLHSATARSPVSARRSLPSIVPAQMARPAAVHQPIKMVASWYDTGVRLEALEELIAEPVEEPKNEMMETLKTGGFFALWYLFNVHAARLEPTTPR